MIICIGCGCSFGPPPLTYKVPLHRGKEVICPNCDKMERERGYLHPSNYTFRVWHKGEFKEVHLLSYQGIEKAVKAMRNMTPEQQRKYLLEKADKIAIPESQI